MLQHDNSSAGQIPQGCCFFDLEENNIENDQMCKMSMSHCLHTILKKI